MQTGDGGMIYLEMSGRRTADLMDAGGQIQFKDRLAWRVDDKFGHILDRSLGLTV